MELFDSRYPDHYAKVFKVFKSLDAPEVEKIWIKDNIAKVVSSMEFEDTEEPLRILSIGGGTGNISIIYIHILNNYLFYTFI